MRTRTFFRYALLAVASAAVACTVHQTGTPSLTGPSEFALSVSVSAVPDSINQDGGSQSSVRVMAHDANGQPKSGQSFRLDILVNGSQVDFGTLSARTVVSGSDGAAFAVYTAPPPQPTGSRVATCSTFNTPGALAGQCVTIDATPIGSNFAASQTQGVEIRLVPPGIIVPPGATPTAAFTSAPGVPTIGAPVQFDASTSCGGPLDAGGTCPSTSPAIVSYAWTFGDGASGSGRLASHAYSAPQNYNATLTVTNAVGVSASKTGAVVVGAGTAPTASFIFSPTPVVHAVTIVNFNADASRAAAGRTIVGFSWDFGDGTTGAFSGASLYAIQHTFAAAGSYVVTLTIIDDIGQKATTTQTVAVT
jgi:PKD repeat protein